VFAKVRGGQAQAFIDAGYREEARVPGFYGGSEDGVFLGLFLDAARGKESRPELVADVLAAARAKQGTGAKDALADGVDIHECQPAHSEEMARIYREVFDSYPFPIFIPSYIRDTMHSNVTYYAASRGDEMLALSSAEMDEAALNVEMTDFATPERHRGLKLATHLLKHMDGQLAARGYKTAYTIARSYSHGMNITFARLGYSFAGTLTANTGIMGTIESMNIWHKPLEA
jgi:putative beta-lysine N-acetyltransferase